MRSILYFLGFSLILLGCNHANTNKISPTDPAKENKENFLHGWNTWDNRSILIQMHLPSELALVLQINDGKSEKYRQYAFPGNRVEGSEKVETIAHAPDRFYTDFTLFMA